MSTPTFPTLPGCGRGASVRIVMHWQERGYGFADACPEHAARVIEAVKAAGFSVIRSPLALWSTRGARCGGGIDRRVWRYIEPVTSTVGPPLTTSTAVTTVQGPAVTAGTSEVPSTTQHPVWCARVTDDGPCEVAGWHAGAWVAVPSELDDAPLIEAQLFTGGPDVLVALRFTYDRETTTQLLPLDQAATVAGALSELAVIGGGR